MPLIKVKSTNSPVRVPAGIVYNAGPATVYLDLDAGSTFATELASGASIDLFDPPPGSRGVPFRGAIDLFDPPPRGRGMPFRGVAIDALARCNGTASLSVRLRPVKPRRLANKWVVDATAPE